MRFTQWSWGDGATRRRCLAWLGQPRRALRHFIAPLRAAGFTVVGIDAPAHGASRGRTSDLPRFRESLAQVLRTHEPVHAVIGHSLGGGATLTDARGDAGIPAEADLPVRRAVDMDYILESFAMMLGLKPRALATCAHDSNGLSACSARDISVTAAGPRAGAGARGARRRRQRRRRSRRASSSPRRSPDRGCC
jgi:pimeloyl-ACP methyl ester carboxylesterase